MSTTRSVCYIKASRAKVYKTLLDEQVLAQWKVPDGMTCHVHTFDPREGGLLRISLTYDAPDGKGKTSGRTDTYHGHFAKLVPNTQIVEVDEFESDDPNLNSPMTITYTLSDEDGGTKLVAVHEGLPDGVKPSDNELGWQMSLARLKALIES